MSTARPARFSRLALPLLAVLFGGCAALFRGAKQDLIRVSGSSADVSITLDRTFIEAFKDRVTIEVPMTVDRADTRPHPAIVDGDFHIAGTSPGIGLTFVAEIQNSARQKEAFDLVRGVVGTGRTLDMAGAWRLWIEHPGESEEIQGGETASAESTNPDHVFEIHPVVRAGKLDLLESLRPVKGYRPGSADLVFRGLEKIPCRISRGETTTTIETPSTRLNDAEFLLETGPGPQQVVGDGRFVDAAVLDLKGNLLAQKVRMAFVANSPPEKIVRGLPPGSRLHVCGLPRISLSEVASRVARSREDPGLLARSLPYEVVVVGVYEPRK